MPRGTFRFKVGGTFCAVTTSQGDAEEPRESKKDMNADIAERLDKLEAQHKSVVYNLVADIFIRFDESSRA